MFTGIIETTGAINEVIINGSNRSFWVSSPISDQLRIDQSVSHNGVCLTVEEVDGGRHRVTAIDETLQKTAIGDWKAGQPVNLERCLRMDGRLDGHFVQGHVDCKGTCREKIEKHGSWEFVIDYPPSFAELVIEKGSICIDGISLTAFDVTSTGFRVAIIPYTYEHTNVSALEPGKAVNLEFDILGKYILRRLSLKGDN
jgi:riboflavin synthase